MAWSQAWIAASPLSLAQSCSASANAAPDDPINKYERTAKYALNMASAHFPKFVIHRSTHFHELRKAMGTSKLIDSSAAFLFGVPGSNSPLVVQELQIGGTRGQLWITFWQSAAIRQGISYTSILSAIPRSAACFWIGVMASFSRIVATPGDSMTGAVTWISCEVERFWTRAAILTV